MKKNYQLLFFIFCISSFNLFSVENITKETFIYAVKDNDTLRLDKYEIPSDTLKPCMIFMFGGGFFTGARDQEFYLPYYNFLVEEGFTVVTIDYRLGLKAIQQNPNAKMKAKEFLAIFQNTIYMAVDDLFDATLFVLANADNWNINPHMILASGSSAGAISVLQGEYERCNRTEAAQKLPADFRYAAVISFAGAIYSSSGNLKWKNTPAPVQLFHGDADKNVPFNKLRFCKYGFFGSKYIAEKYEKNNFPYFFYIEENQNHHLAGAPMNENHEEIRTFIHKYVFQKMPLYITMDVRNANVPEVKKKKFKIKDYVSTNLGE